MTSDDVKAALRRRHPGQQHMGSRLIHGAWTTIEEWMGIDLLAISSHATPSSGRVPGVRYPRVGYEIKVSRSDLRRELLRPFKRRLAVEWCNAFYFAVPRGLLTADEVTFVEPVWERGDFERTPCRYSTLGADAPAYRDDPGPCYHGKRDQRFIGPMPKNRYRSLERVKCDGCGGRGYGEASRVERDAPTLWIPRDVGLVEIDGRGCHVTRPSPVRRDVPAVAAGAELANLIRWVSVRPDPRHLELLARRSPEPASEALPAADDPGRPETPTPVPRRETPSYELALDLGDLDVGMPDPAPAPPSV